jgi:hypothetical protein
MKKMIGSFLAALFAAIYVPCSFSACPGLKPEVQAILQGIPTSLVLVEGQSSNPYSSVRGEPDHFVIPAPNELGVRILRADPFTVGTFQPWGYGIEQTNMILLDVVSRDVFTAPFTRHVFGPTTVDDCSLLLDGRLVHVRVSNSGRYPSTMLTWGIDSTNGFWGRFSDEVCAGIVEPLVPVPTVAELQTRIESLLVENQTYSNAVQQLLAEVVSQKTLIESLKQQIIELKAQTNGLRPQIVVTNPKKDEKWNVGSSETIKWDTKYIPHDTIMAIGARGYGSFTEIGEDGLPYSATEKDFFIAEVPNTGKLKYEVKLPPGKYKIFIKTDVSGIKVLAWDESFITVSKK